MFDLSMFNAPTVSASLAAVPESPQAFAGWVARRRPPRLTDQGLTDVTRTWLQRLPPGRRPVRLATRFPRVANRVALCWADTALAEQVLDDLLVDRRGGRRGFPLRVARELQRLRDYRRA